ncbi:hypothetical protein KAH37_06980 [bacterium]|nr:hypothetical protein [bacterium]
MKQMKILLLLLIVFILSCGGGTDPVDTGDREQSDLDVADTDHGDTTPSCNYSGTDNKIKASVDKLTFVSDYFGTVSMKKFVTISNKCTKCTGAGLKLQQLAISPPTDDFKILVNPLAEGSIYLKKGEETQIGVQYTVSTWDKVAVDLQIFSDDVCKPKFSIPLTGYPKSSSHIVVETPDDTVVDDLTMEFGDVGKEKANKLVIKNVGLASLTLNSMNIVLGYSSGEGDPGFVIKTPLAPGASVAAGESTTLEITCRNSTEFPETVQGELVINSNDVTEYGENASLVIRLECGPQRENAPIAALECKPEEIPILGWASMDGSKSKDYNGKTDGLKYLWRFKRTPAGTGATIVDFDDVTKPVTNLLSDSVKTKFQALMQGLYTISLVVQNSEGALSSPVSCDINSVPDDDLRVKMVWNNPDADVDLHLIAPSGSYADPQTDCYFYNCAPQYSGDRPDWGEVGVDKDDPGLDIDNITGMGPETAFVNKPANGVYKVIVHSYDLESGPTKVVVKVYGHAIQIATQEQMMTRTNLCWDVYDITVADDANGDGKKEITVTNLTDEPYDCDPPPLSSH